MQLRPEEISKIIKDQIKHYDNQIVQTDVGTVLLVGDGIARVSGLENCMANELVRFSTGAYGMALNLEENSVAVVMLGDDVGIKEGDTVERTREVVSVPVGEALIGRVVYHVPVIGRLMMVYASDIGKGYVLLFATCGVMFTLPSDWNS